MVITEKPADSRRIFLALVVLSLAFITIYFRESELGMMHRTQKAAMAAIAPLQKTVTGLTMGISESWHSFTNAFSLSRENRELKEEVRRLEDQQSIVKAVQDENKRISALLKFRDRLGQKSVAARVIGIGGASQNRIVLDKGSQDGIKENSPVLSDKGLMGRVIRLSAKASLVTLLYDPRSSIGALVERTGDLALVEGSGGELLELKDTKADIEIRLKDKVITSGIGGVFPKGLLIGTVVDIVRDDSQIEPIIMVKSDVNINETSEVIVLLTETEEPPGGWGD